VGREIVESAPDEVEDLPDVRYWNDVAPAVSDARERRL